MYLLLLKLVLEYFHKIPILSKNQYVSKIQVSSDTPAGFSAQSKEKMFF